MVEKPFGRDLRRRARPEPTRWPSISTRRQIYRIDHYLGKETVQNLMAVRFGNVLFEPLWNSQYVDHIQITVAETVGVGGRGGYYDKSGAMRDMVQNHLMQLLCLIAMEPPSRFEPDAVRDEKLKVIRALEPVRARRHRARPVRGRRPAARYREDVEDAAQPHRKLRRAEGARVELALGGHAVLPAHRQAAARPAVRDRGGVQGRAAFDLRRGQPASIATC